MRAVLLDRATLGHDVDLSTLTSMDFDWEVYDQTLPEQVNERISSAAVVLSNKVVLRNEEMTSAQGLRYIGVLATGTNNIDLEAARERSIAVSNIQAYGTPSVAQHTLAMILSLATSLPRYSRLSSDGTWANSNMFCVMDRPVMELSGKTLLIVGYGELGRAVGRLAEAFGMHVLVARVPGSESSDQGRVSLDEGLARADVVSLHCPLTERTRNMIGARRLGFMKPHALLINTARGGLVEEHSLVTALKSGKLGGAGFDVLVEEPPVNGSPLLSADIDNLIVTPHSAWLARESRQRLVEMAAENLAAFVLGQPVNRVV